jgi:hypothetical protein
MAKVEERAGRDTKIICKKIIDQGSHSDPTWKGTVVAGRAVPNSPDHPRPYACISIRSSDTHVLEFSPETSTRGFHLVEMPCIGGMNSWFQFVVLDV